MEEGKKKVRKRSSMSIEEQRVNYDILHNSIWKMFRYLWLLELGWCMMVARLTDLGWRTCLELGVRRPFLLLAVLLMFEACYKFDFLQVNDVIFVAVTDLAVAIVVLPDYLTRGVELMCALPVIIGLVLRHEKLIYVQAGYTVLALIFHEYILYHNYMVPVTDHPGLNIIDCIYVTAVITAVVLQMRKYTQLLDNQSTIDSLTRLHNHEAFYEMLDYKLAASSGESAPICILIADIDNFKKVNDTFGHAYGDTVLKVLAEIFHDESSERCFAARYGGEEFAMILEMDQADALTKAQAIRKRFEHSTVPTEDGIENHFTVSIGVARYSTEFKTSSQFFEKADSALYKAKAGGKNRVCL